MNDELERRLQALGQRSVPPLARDRVQAIEDDLLVAPRRASRAPWFAVAAAAVLVLAGVAFALQRTTDRTLEPATTPSVHEDDGAIATSTSASTPPSTTLPTDPSTTVASTVPPTSVDAVAPTAPGTSQPSGSVPPTTATLPPSTTTATTSPPPTSAPGQPVPPASFALTVERIGTRLVFNWPAQTGTGGVRYALVRVTPAGLQHWPVAESRIARVIPGIESTRTIIDKPDTSAASWVIVVLGPDRQLLAVSTTVTSN